MLEKTHERKSKMDKKLKSRKLWMSIVSATLLIVNEGLGIMVDSNTIIGFAGIVSSYIWGQSIVDARK